MEKGKYTMEFDISIDEDNKPIPGTYVKIKADERYIEKKIKIK